MDHCFPCRTRRTGAKGFTCNQRRSPGGHGRGKKAVSMIILKHLTVERFRLLREINLHFPQRGSILIQGPNEAGKSALLESIYFALYGEPLTSNRALDDLVLYGAAQATITLTLSIGTTELSITRIIERGKGQQVTLHVQKAGIPAEPL